MAMGLYPEWLAGGVDNCDILVNDGAGMFDFYHRTLGLPARLEWDASVGVACVSTGNIDLFLIETPNASHMPRFEGDFGGSPAGIACISLRVDDYDAAVRALDGKVEWATEEEMWEAPGGWVSRYRHFYDPEGNQLLLTKMTDKPQPKPRIAGKPDAASEQAAGITSKARKG